MGRRRKSPTKPVRLATEIIRMNKRRAKKKGMSLPDYLAWRLK